MTELIATCGLIWLGSAICLGAIFSGVGETFDRRLAGNAVEPMERTPLVREVRRSAKVAPNLSSSFRRFYSGLDRLLIYAGRPYGDLSAAQFLDALLLFGIAFGTIMSAAFLTIGTLDVVSDPIGSALRVLSLFGFCLLVVPVVFILGLLSRANQVSESISLDFPFFLDLALLVVQAGGTPIQALRTYVENNPTSYLGRELQVTVQDSEIQGLDMALLAMSKRIQPESVRMILRNLAQSERSTGRVADFYAEQAVELRSLRYELAERAADRVKLNMTFPTVLMTMAIALAVLAGTIIQLQGII
ncbi:MAG: type II secretion system F family protein [Hyphomicrobiales bacterium]